MYAKAVPASEQGSHINPWDGLPAPSEVPYQQFSQDLWTWTTPSLPLPGIPDCSLLVWVLPSGEAAFRRQREDFTAGGSGYAAKCAPAMPLCPETAALPDDVLLMDVMPRTYKMSVAVRSVPLAGACNDFLLEGMLTSSYVYLHYDPHLSTPTEAVWLGTNLADSSAHWALRVMRRGTTWCAVVVLRQLSQRKVESPLVWSCASWKLFDCNQLNCPAEAAAASNLSTLIIEPA
jgi:hypothetical protein